MSFPIARSYDMITDDVAIGSCDASYKPFDLIIDLDYPANRVELNEIRENFTNFVGQGTYIKDRYLIRCGYIDSLDGLTLEKLNDLLERIENYKLKFIKTPKILFHCHAGISRSTTVAIAYLANRDRKSTREIYELAKQKRPQIQPNLFFKELLDLVPTEHPYNSD